MNLRSKERNIPLMYAICFFQGIVLYASISTLYRQARGLSLAEYAVIDGFSYILQLAFEIPFGMLADRATQLSVYSMVAEIFCFGLSMAMSAVTTFSYNGAFVFCTGMSVIGIFLFLYCYKGVRTLDD